MFSKGITYREYVDLTNAWQASMPQEWVVFDLRTPPGTVWPGKVVDAGFFDEEWRLKPAGQ